MKLPDVFTLFCPRCGDELVAKVARLDTILRPRDVAVTVTVVPPRHECPRPVNALESAADADHPVVDGNVPCRRANGLHCHRHDVDHWRER